ncbi:MAG: metallophosphoesterase [Candidatus Diapherotrites archaeon]|nr:metallophosphoesterase [Candidatus Diapherotrites archaeon]
MLLVAVSDIHGDLAKLEKFKQFLAEQNIQPDALFVCGDLTHYGSYEDAVQILSSIKVISERLFAVVGNADRWEVAKALEEFNCSLNFRCTEFDGFRIAGASGSAGDVGEVIFTEKELSNKLRALESCTPLEIFVSHSPPKNVLDYTANGTNIGSTAIREFIKKTKPKLHIFGHVHESTGSKVIENVMCVNVAAIKEGRFALIELDENANVLAIKFLEFG